MCEHEVSDPLRRPGRHSLPPSVVHVSSDRRLWHVEEAGDRPDRPVPIAKPEDQGPDRLIDRSAIRGQAGVTERIDNYPGFPDGVGGAELAARMEAQARRYGVELLSAVGVQQLGREGDEVLATTTSGDRYRGRAALIATGTSHRRLGVWERLVRQLTVPSSTRAHRRFQRARGRLTIFGSGPQTRIWVATSLPLLPGERPEISDARSTLESGSGTPEVGRTSTPGLVPVC
jgi:hypothetical protein